MAGNHVRPPPPMFGMPAGVRGPIGGGEFVQPTPSQRIDPSQMPRPGHVQPQAEPEASLICPAHAAQWHNTACPILCACSPVRQAKLA